MGKRQERLAAEFDLMLRDLISSAVFGGDVDPDTMDRIIQAFDAASDEDSLVQLLRPLELNIGEMGALQRIYQEEVKIRKKRKGRREKSAGRRSCDRFCGAMTVVVALIVFAARYHDDALAGAKEAADDGKEDGKELLVWIGKTLATKEIEDWNDEYWIDIPKFIARMVERDPGFRARFQREIEERNELRKQARDQRNRTDENKDPIADWVREKVYGLVDRRIDEQTKAITDMNDEELVEYLRGMFN